jgi:glycopeptide antibiotics resistance protein
MLHRFFPALNAIMAAIASSEQVLSMKPFSHWFPLPTTASSVLLRRWSLKLLLASVLLVLICTLYPFNFAVGESNPLKQVAIGFTNRTNLQDLLANVILFIPLGFSVASLLHSANLRSIDKLAIVLSTGAALSSMVELLQVFLPARTPTYSDVLTNVMGAGLGWLGFQLGGIPLFTRMSRWMDVFSRWEKKLTQGQLLITFFGATLLTFGTAVALQTGTLSNWNSAYPMILGNNQSGQRAWEGTIATVLIADRAVSGLEANRLLAGNVSAVFNASSLLSIYAVSGRAPYRDQTGLSPDLIWRGQPPLAATVPPLTPNHWLATDGAVTGMNQRLTQSSEFTLVTTVTPATLNHNYFARFLSIAASPNEYNLVLGQVGQLLFFWLRTTRNAAVNQMPNGFIGGIFTVGMPRKLVLTYAGLSVRLYTDASPVPYTFDLTSVNYRIGLLSLIFAPLGMILALIAKRLQQPLPLQIILIGSAVVLLPYLLEVALVWQSGRSVSRSNLLLGNLVLLSVLLMFRRWPQQLNPRSARQKSN